MEGPEYICAPEREMLWARRRHRKRGGPEGESANERGGKERKKLPQEVKISPGDPDCGESQAADCPTVARPKIRGLCWSPKVRHAEGWRRKGCVWCVAGCGKKGEGFCPPNKALGVAPTPKEKERPKRPEVIPWISWEFFQKVP